MEAAVERPTAKQPSLGKLFFFGQVANSTQQTVALSIVILICSVTFDWIRKKIDRYCRNKDGTKKEQTIYCPMQ